MGYSDNREKNFEYKLVRKALTELDHCIHVPDDVSGASLRHLLDNIPEPATGNSAKTKRGALLWNPRWFRLQSGLTYAAAFVLIVAVFYGLGFNRTPDIVSGGAPLASSGTDDAAAEADVFDMFMVETADMDESVMESAQVPDNPPPPDTGGTGAERPVAADTAQPAQYGEGGIQTTRLLDDGDHAYTYRQNDSADPDKAGFPLTVEIVDREEQVLSQIDIPDMTTIQTAILHENYLVIAGTFDNALVLRSYNIEDRSAPQEAASAVQPGRYLDARLYKGVVHAVTLTDSESVQDMEAVPIPDSTSEDVCVITAFAPNGEVAQKAFTGATDDVTLMQLNAYIYFNSRQEDGGLISLHCAQIRLDGMNMDLIDIT